MGNLIADLGERDIRPSRVLHLWLVTPEGQPGRQGPEIFNALHDLGLLVAVPPGAGLVHHGMAPPFGSM